MRWRSAIGAAVLSMAIAACGGTSPAAPTSSARSPWRPPIRLGPTEGRLTLGFPTVASDAQGHAIAAWIEEVRGADRTRWNVRAVRFDPAGGWGPSQIVVQTDDDYPANPRIVANGAGDAALAWSARFALFSPRTGWTAPYSLPGLEDPLRSVRELRLAMAEDGSAMAVWAGEQGGGYEPWRQRLRAAVLTREGWGPPSVISESRAPYYAPITIGMDEAGNATATWLESGRPDLMEEPAAVWTNRFQNGRGWGRRQRLGPYPHTSGGGTLVADVDAQGRAVAIWRDDAGLEASFSGRDGWTAPARLGITGGFSPEVRLLPGGGAVVAWASDAYAAQAVVFEEGRGWSAPLSLSDTHETDRTQDGGASSLGVDAAGHAWITWTDGIVQAARFTSSHGWERPWPLQTTSRLGTSPQIAVSPGGETFAVWKEEGPAPDYRDEIWAAAYAPEAR